MCYKEIEGHHIKKRIFKSENPEESIEANIVVSSKVIRGHSHKQGTKLLKWYTSTQEKKRGFLKMDAVLGMVCLYIKSVWQ